MFSAAIFMLGSLTGVVGAVAGAAGAAAKGVAGVAAGVASKAAAQAGARTARAKQNNPNNYYHRDKLEYQRQAERWENIGELMDKRGPKSEKTVHNAGALGAGLWTTASTFTMIGAFTDPAVR